MKDVLYASDQLESVCEFRYNECIVKNDGLNFHSHDYYELFFLEDSPQVHYVNGDCFELPKNSLVFVRPDDYHDFYNNTGRDVTVLQLAFSLDMGNGLFEFLTPLFPSKQLLCAKYSPYVILNSVEAKSLLKMIASLNTIAVDDMITKSISMRAVLTQIFSKFFYKREPENKEEIPLWLLDTCSAMNKVSNFYEGLSRMTELSGKTKEHLCRSVKKYYGITAADFINDLRLTYIANRLLNSDHNIIDICYESGFSNLGWMYTLFKKKYGCSPAAFRKNI